MPSKRLSLPSQTELYHVYHEYVPNRDREVEDARWVLIGHGNSKPTRVADSWSEIKTEVNKLLGYQGGSGRAFAVVHWEPSTKIGWHVNYIYMNKSITLDGRSVSAKHGGM